MVRASSLQKKSYVICTLIILTTTVCLILQPQSPSYEYIAINDNGGPNEMDNEYRKQWLESRNVLYKYNLSNLGKILFLGEDEPVITSPERYQILVWKYGPRIENRHLKAYSGARLDPLEMCSVKNCDLTYADSAISTADIVIFHMQRIKGLQDLPKGVRNPRQIWAFLTDESPYHMFFTKGLKIGLFNGIFNWSMTYRKDSDIPVPYGRTILKKHQSPSSEITLRKRRDVLIAILGSNCGGRNKRWDYVKELQKHIAVDVYGACGPLKTCPGHFGADCPKISDYLFYLAFENSNCDDYITEKLWWNAYAKNSIPIVMGAEKSNYNLFLPPGSYINIEEFASPAVLAQFIFHLNATEDYKIYYEWKNTFAVVNEHGYFKSRSYHYCRVCQALNYNNKTTKVYKNLEDFWNVKRDCHPAWNEV